MLFCQNLLEMVVLLNFHLSPATSTIVCSFIYYISQEPVQANTENYRFLFAGFYYISLKGSC